MLKISKYNKLMEGLPKDTDLSALIGREITMVRIGKFQLHYFLNEDLPEKPSVWIQIESSDVTVVDASGRVTKIDDFRTNGGPLCFLLGLQIEKVHHRDDGGLVLELSGGFRLEVGIDTPMYKSIVLHIGDKAITGETLIVTPPPFSPAMLPLPHAPAGPRDRFTGRAHGGLPCALFCLCNL